MGNPSQELSDFILYGTLGSCSAEHLNRAQEEFDRRLLWTLEPAGQDNDEQLPSLVEGGDSCGGGGIGTARGEDSAGDQHAEDTRRTAAQCFNRNARREAECDREQCLLPGRPERSAGVYTARFQD